MNKKKHLERNVMENEVFTEAVPSTLIMTFLMCVLVLSESLDAQLLVGEDHGYGKTLFYFTFATSALSAGLGLAKCLKVSTVSAQPLNMQTMLTRTFQFYIKHNNYCQKCTKKARPLSIGNLSKNERWDPVVSWQKAVVWEGSLHPGFKI